MIELNDKDTKDYFNKLIDAEINRINISLIEQKDFNSSLLDCLEDTTDNIAFSSKSKLFPTSSLSLTSISQLLSKTSSNFSSYAKLLNELEAIKASISLDDRKTFNDIERYNQTSVNVFKRIATNTKKIEEFFANIDSLHSSVIINKPLEHFTNNEKELIVDTPYVETVQESTIALEDTSITVSCSSESEKIAKIINEIKSEPVPQEVLPENVSEATSIPQAIVPKEISNSENIKAGSDSTVKKEVITETLFDIPALLAQAGSSIPKITFDEEETTAENVHGKFSAVLDELIQTPTPANSKKRNSGTTGDNALNIEPSHVLLENTLIISDTDENVILPYTISDLQNILDQNPNKYKSLERVVQMIYTVPLKSYKNSAVSRFREAYKLIRKKESGSIGEAVDLGMELFSNYNLHPAIISACKNLNELDIYLSCLEYNELDDFKFFKVVFNTAPSLTKSSNKLFEQKRMAGAKLAKLKQVSGHGRRTA